MHISEQDHHLLNREPLILLIDDDPGMLRVLTSVLSIGGYQVTTAANGKDALHLIAIHVFDAIISDVDLPDNYGFEICQAVKRNSKLSAAAVILMSGRLSEEVRPKAMEAGANDFLSKPFPGKILLEKLSTLLSQEGNKS